MSRQDRSMSFNSGAYFGSRSICHPGRAANLQRALAIYARGTASGELPIKDKAALLAELEKALNSVRTFAEARGVKPAAIINAKGLARLKAIKYPTQRVFDLRNDEMMREHQIAPKFCREAANKKLLAVWRYESAPLD